MRKKEKVRVRKWGRSVEEKNGMGKRVIGKEKQCKKQRE